MENSRIELGGVYTTKWSSKPLRVISLDEYEIFYDCLWGNDTWGLSTRMKNVAFYRISQGKFSEGAKMIDMKPLNEKENKLFRPDLPLRFCRNKSLNWFELSDQAIETIANDTPNYALPVGTIVLTPFSRNNNITAEKGVILQSEDRTSFSIKELLWKTREIHSNRKRIDSNGIGIYRSGIEKGFPSYYIGAYFDLAGVMKEVEEQLTTKT